ncbi:SpoIIE family protein phosphatase [Streptomyces sp. NBC_01450]|uniref:SpoIIE family protein phosphatase n=1 Tax=Streptomyces sp. NBC_01450 TaxID=2903871 RepID=UPI002E35CF7B|nr:SpoIIE family protein phosphatase [Streptomyces sp. NBC_01450]
MSTPMEHPSRRVGDAMVEEAFTQCHVPVAICDAELRILRASSGMTHEAGLTEDQMRGRRFTQFMPGTAYEEVEGGICRVFKTGVAEHLEVYADARAEPGEQVWSVTLSPLRNAAGQVHRVQFTAVDTTAEYGARERLALLNEVSARVGSTLDVAQTAQEMVDAVAGRLADFVTVDLLDSLFRGVEPRPSGEGVALLRAAHQSVLPGVPESVIRVGEVDYYPQSSPPARVMATGRSSLHRTLDRAIERWATGDPQRARVVHAHGVHSVMVVPLSARDITLGVAVLVRHQRRAPFTEDDLLLAEEIAARAAVAVDNARRYTRERTTAEALQRSLLPQQLAEQEAVQVACRYLPARSRAGVGGDWFDVIPLSGARVALVVGDVVGHGLRASATMGRLRTAVRTLADVDLPPDELLVHLDDLVTHLTAEEDTAIDPGLETVTDLVATCVYVVYDPISHRCTVASAGHPPPAVVTPDGTVDFLDVPPGPPLGVGGLPFEVTERELPEGSLLALYTDGLAEACGRDIDAGLEQLRRALTGPADQPEEVCEAVLDSLLHGQPTDDIALLIARTRALDSRQVATWDLAGDPAAVAGTRAEVARRLAAWGLEEIAFTVELVVSELVTNAIRYGGPPIQLRVIRDTAVICEVSDSSSAAPHLRRARIFDEGGRGLLLVAQLARRWGTRHKAAGKTIWAEVALPEGQP